MKELSHDIFNRGIDTLKSTALSNHKPGILNNYIILFIFLSVACLTSLLNIRDIFNHHSG